MGHEQLPIPEMSEALRRLTGALGAGLPSTPSFLGWKSCPIGLVPPRA